MRKILLKGWAKALFALMVMFSVDGVAQRSISATGVAVTEDFTGMTGSSWSNNTTVTGWYAAREASGPNFTALTQGTGSANSGAIYSFGTAGSNERALGSGASGSTNTVWFGLRLKNNTSVDITSLDVSYIAEQWRKESNATAQTYAFHYRVAETVTSLTSGTWTAFSALNMTTPQASSAAATALDGNLAANRVNLSATIEVTIPAGHEIMIRWTDLNDSGNDHHMAVDDLSITANGGPQLPEINIQGLSNDIVSGDATPSETDGTDFGVANIVTGTVVRTFTIQNTGAGALNLTGTPLVSLSAENGFSVTAQPDATVDPDGSTTFEITFDPSEVGVETVTVSIANDDEDEDPYTFTITGEGTADPDPQEINVQGNGVDIVSGDDTPDAADNTSFGSIQIGATVTRTYTIQNTGTLDLELDAVTLLNGSAFSVSLQPASTVAGGASTTFEITYTPTAVGTFNDVVVIGSNDADESVYTFAVSGSATLSTPTAIAATDVATTSFVANWNAVPGATGYRLDVSTSSDFLDEQLASNLIISEYGEADTGTNKYIEIFNGTGVDVNLANYRIWSINNGGEWSEGTINLSGTLANGDVYVIANSAWVVGADVSTGVQAMSFNGDDAIGLAWNGGSGTTFALIDAIGTNGPDPGTGWNVAGVINATANRILIRKPTVLHPNTNWAAAAGTNAENSEWIVSDFIWNEASQITDLGSHTFENVESTYVFGYKNLAVSGTSHEVTGLTNGTNYYYRVRAEADEITTPNSNVIGVITVAEAASFGSISQAFPACQDTNAVLLIQGLLPGSTSTLTYTVNGGEEQTLTGIVADETGNSVWIFPVTLADNGSEIAIVSIERTDVASAPVAVTENNVVALDVNENVTYYLDNDGDGFGTNAGTAIACDGVPAGYATNNTDCDDTNADIFQTGNLYVDADNDGYTSGVLVENVCYGATVPSGYVLELTAIDCNDDVAAINPGATEIPGNGIDDNCNGTIDEGSQVFSQVQPTQCGTTLTNIGSLIGAISRPGATGYRFEVTNTETNAVQTLDRGVPNFSMTMLTAYDYATTYSIRVMLQINGVWLNYYGESCLVATPAITAPGGAAQVSPSQCGIQLASINTLIATTSLPGVAQYRFRVTDLTDGDGPFQVQILDRPLHWFNLKMLDRYNYGTQYSIEVAVRTNGSANFTGFGVPCIITTPDVPGINQCDQVIASPTTMISTNSLLNVTQYRYVLTNMSTFTVSTIERGLHYFRFVDVPEYAPGVEYGVQVAVMTSGEWSPLTDACIITAPGGTRENVKNSAIAFDAVAYPNPFADTFNIELSATADADVTVKVYDMTGRMLDQKVVSGTEMQTLQVGERYPAGVYNVIVSQGDQAKTLRVIKR